MSRPLLPLHEKPLTPREAADCLRGLAEMLETYPATGVLLTLDVTVVQAAEPAPRKRRTTKAPVNSP
jgi:hypothetical protein